MSNNFMPQNQDQEEIKKSACEIKVEKLLQYAQEIYECEMEEEYIKEMKGYATNLSDIPATNVVDSLKREWDIWKQYLDPKSFSNFIRAGIKSLLRIQTTNTSSCEELRAYVGQKAGIIRELPEFFSTTVTLKGLVFKNGILLDK